DSRADLVQVTVAGKAAADENEAPAQQQIRGCAAQRTECLDHVALLLASTRLEPRNREDDPLLGQLGTRGIDRRIEQQGRLQSPTASHPPARVLRVGPERRL